MKSSLHAIMILCIGPPGSGKTILLRKLQQDDVFNNPFDEIFSTVQTKGVNIINLKLGKQKQIQVHELGGSMSPIWSMHYADAKGVIYVIDSANTFQSSCATILLLEALNHPLLKGTKFIIVFNKTDIFCSTQLSELKSLMRFDDICSHASQEVAVVECSCLTGKGVKDVKDWLSRLIQA